MKIPIKIPDSAVADVEEYCRIESELRDDYHARCTHDKTVCINEEGHAGIYCVDCGKKLEDGC